MHGKIALEVCDLHLNVGILEVNYFTRWLWEMTSRVGPVAHNLYFIIFSAVIQQRLLVSSLDVCSTMAVSTDISHCLIRFNIWTGWKWLTHTAGLAAWLMLTSSLSAMPWVVSDSPSTSNIMLISDNLFIIASASFFLRRCSSTCSRRLTERFEIVLSKSIRKAKAAVL